MNRLLLFIGGLMNLALAVFKIAMPHLFHWREAMGLSKSGMWAILYAENLGISLLLLFFAYISVFQWKELLETTLGKTVMLSMICLWIFRSIAEVALFKVGVDGAWWRVFLFLGIAVIYVIALTAAAQMADEKLNTQRAIGTKL